MGWHRQSVRISESNGLGQTFEVAMAKNFTDYILTNREHRVVTLAHYSVSPASAFFKYVVNAKDASVTCTNKFKTTARKHPYTDDALDSIYIINAGLLAAIMGNFETFQKYLFAKMFDYSIYLQGFKVDSFIKKIKDVYKGPKSTEFEIDFVRLAAFRDNQVL